MFALIDDKGVNEQLPEIGTPGDVACACGTAGRPLRFLRPMPEDDHDLDARRFPFAWIAAARFQRLGSASLALAAALGVAGVVIAAVMLVGFQANVLSRALTAQVDIRPTPAQPAAQPSPEARPSLSLESQQLKSTDARPSPPAEVLQPPSLDARRQPSPDAHEELVVATLPSPESDSVVAPDAAPPPVVAPPDSVSYFRPPRIHRHHHEYASDDPPQHSAKPVIARHRRVLASFSLDRGCFSFHRGRCAWPSLALGSPPRPPADLAPRPLRRAFFSDLTFTLRLPHVRVRQPICQHIGRVQSCRTRVARVGRGLV